MPEQMRTWLELYKATKWTTAVAGVAIIAALAGWFAWLHADRRARAACHVVALVVAERDSLGRERPAWMRLREIDAAYSACSDREASSYE
jgi:hypothetical protein